MSFLDDIEKQDGIDSQKQRLEEVIEWGQDKDWFDDSFIQSLLKRVEGGRELTEKQLAAFENVEQMVSEHEDRDSDWENEEDAYGVNHGCDFNADDIPF